MQRARTNEAAGASTVPRLRPPSLSAAASRLVRSKLLQQLYELCGRPEVTFRLWDGAAIGPSGSTRPALVVQDTATLLRLLIDPESAFSDGYISGMIRIEGDLVALLEALFHAPAGRHPVAELARAIRPIRRSAAPHGDLGTDFYRLWLDRDLVHSCAYFASTDQPLEAAQRAKLDHVCRKLRLRPGDSVIEADCGWGALAFHMAAHYGVTVRAYNVSKDQLVWTRARARTLDLADRVEFVEGDWRTINDHADVFVSLGMLEWVGQESYEGLGRKMADVIGHEGRGLVQAMGRTRPGRPSPWLEEVFSGSVPPSLSQMMPLFEPNELVVCDVENLRPHCERTLRHWLMRYEKSVAQVDRLFGARFVRLWRLHLAGLIASCTAESVQLYQIVFLPEQSRDVTWTRAHLYATPAQEHAA